MSDAYQKILGEINFDKAKKASQATIEQAIPSGSYGNTLDSIKEYRAGRKENVEKFDYTIPLSNDEYDIINANIANSKTPEEDAFNIASAMTLSKELDLPIEYTANNLEALSQFMLGRQYEPRKEWYDAVRDSFRSAQLSNEYGRLAGKWRDSGESPELGQQLATLQAQIEGLQDKFPRSWVTEGLKFGAQILPFTMEAVAAGAAGAAAGTAGALLMAGGAGITVGSGGVLSGAGIPLTAAGAAMTVGAFSAFGSAVASTIQGYQTISGQEYKRMRDNGVSKNVALGMSSFSGLAQSITETLLGSTSGALKAIAGKPVESLTAKTIQKMVVKGNFRAGAEKLMTRGVGNYVGGAFDEAVEEVVQGLIADGTDVLTGVLVDEGIDRPTAASVAKNAWENAVGGMAGGLILGGLPAAIDMKRQGTQLKQVRSMASTMSEDDFAYMANFLTENGRIDLFGDKRGEDLDKAARAFYSTNKEYQTAQERSSMTVDERKQAEAIAETIDTDDMAPGADTETADTGDVKPGAPKRLSTGRLFVQDAKAEPRVNADGSSTQDFLVGDPETGKRYGYIQYTTTQDGEVKIDAVRLKQGYEGLRKDAIKEFLIKNKGLNISWEPTSDAARTMRDELVQENPRGQDQGLNWYTEGENVEESLKLRDLENKIAKNIPNMDAEQRAGGIAVVKAFAAYKGMTPEQYVDRFFTEDVFGQDTRVDVSQGKRGGMSWKTIGGQAKAVIYASKNADFSTWVHENAHILRPNLEQKDTDILKNAYGVEENWTIEQEEKFASDVEKYLTNGEAPNNELRALFEKIAKWMKEIYRAIVGKVDIDPRVVDVMDRIFAGEQKEAGMFDWIDERKNDGIVFQGESITNTTEYKKLVDILSYSGVYRFVESMSDKSVVNSLKADSKSISDFLESQSILPESKRFIDIPSSVISKVISVSDNQEIFRSIVRSIPVDVMDFFERKQISTDNLFSNESMLKDVLTINTSADISLPIDKSIPSLLLSSIARKTAELSSLADWALENKAAILANTKDSIFGTHKESISLNKNFFNWFGDSKVVDADGKPLVVYHGSPDARFSKGDDAQFKTEKERIGIGKSTGAFWFTPSRKTANSYADDRRAFDYQNAEAGIVEAYLSIQNPLEIDAGGKEWREAQARGKTSDVIEQAMAEGRDGVIIRRVRDDYNNTKSTMPTDTYVAFSPTQIKSVNNQGAWSKDDPRILYQPAYHGTPHTVDRFSTDKIGTGEGAQAFGWGLYFAGDVEVAEWYRYKLTTQTYKDAVFIYNGIPITKYGTAYDGKLGQALKYMADLWDKNKNLSANEAIDLADKKSNFNYSKGYFQKEFEILRSESDKVIKAEKNQGHIYKVEIPEHDEYLDWDKPLSEQSEKVKEAIKNIPDSIGMDWNGKKLYSRISNEGLGPNMLNGDKAASLYLRSLGIPGIRYLDGQSRGQGEGEYNYVIFDENDVQISEVLFQTEEELSAEARTFPTWTEFMDFYESFGAPDDFASPDLEPEELAEWYKSVWEKANEQPAMTPTQADEAFRRDIETDEGLERFMESLRLTMTKDTSMGPADEMEAEDFERTNALQRRIGIEASTTIQLNLTRLASGKEMTEAAKKSIRTTIKNNTRDYRALYADVTGDQRYKVADADKTLGGVEIEGRKAEDIEYSIAERNDVAMKLQNEETRNAILSGEEVIGDGKVEALILAKEKEIKDLRKSVAELEAEIKEDNKTISGANRQAVQAIKSEKEATKKYEKLDREVKKLIEKGQAVSETLASARREAALQVKLAKVDAREAVKDERVAGNVRKQEALDTMRKGILEAVKEQNQAKAAKEQKLKIAKSIMRKVSPDIEYEYRRKIEAIQSYVDPNFRRASVDWMGAIYKVSDIDQILRENTEYDFSKLLTKKIVDRLTKKDLSQWTMAELEEMHQKVEGLRREGRAIRLAYSLNQRTEAAQLRDSIAGVVMSLKKYQGTPPNETEAKKAAIKPMNILRDRWLSTINMARKAMILDGGKQGKNWELLVGRAREVFNAENTEIDRRTENVMKAMANLGITMDDLYKEADIPNSAEDGRTATWSNAELLGFSLAVMDEKSKQAAIYGNLTSPRERKGMTSDQLTMLALERFKNVMARVEALPDSMKQFAEAIKKDFDENFDRLREVNIREFNEDIKKVVNYFPMFRKDATFDDIPSVVANDLLNRSGIQLSRNADKGFTKERVDFKPENQMPIRLDIFDVWLTAMKTQEHFVSSAEYVRELNRIYKNQGSEKLQSIIKGSFGKRMLDDVQEHILEIASPSRFRERDDSQKIIRSLRGKVGVGYLGARLSTVVNQLVTSPGPYLGYVSPLELSSSALKVGVNPIKAWEEISGKSKILKHRSANDTMQLLREAQDKARKGNVSAGWDKIMGRTMIGLEWADRVSVMAGWKAVYDKQIGKGLTEEQAIAKADDATLMTQPSGYDWNNSPIFQSKNSEAWKLILQFQSPLNIIWQNLTYDLPNAVKQGEISKAVGMAMGYLIAGTASGLLRKGFDDDDEAFDKARKLLFWSLSQGVVSIPVAGSIVESAVESIITGDKPAFFTGDLFPALSSGATTATALAQGDWEKAMKELGETLGYTFGAPVSGVKEALDAATGNPARLVGRRK